jgi:hypothetical protein
VVALAVTALTVTEAVSVSAPTVVLTAGDSVTTAWPEEFVKAVGELSTPYPSALANVTT